MRLDQYLKLSRLIHRRSLAQEFCEAGAVHVNGAEARSSKNVKPGDEVEIKRGTRVTKVRVTKLPEGKQVSKTAAGELYELVGETAANDQPNISAIADS